MRELEKTLANRLASAKRIAVLGIGSDLRADDSAGVIAAEELKKRLKKRKSRAPRIEVFIGGTAPENLTGEIRKMAPSHIIIIDSLEMEKDPGAVILVDPAGTGEGVTFSTHTMPAKILADYFINSLKCGITMIGIQPKTIKFGKPPTKSVISSARNVAKSISEAIEGLTN